MKRAPKRGDIVRISLDPTLGTEQRGTRPALVVSANAFNALGMAMICPITQGGDFSRGKHWTVALAGTGTETQGVVLCNQARIVDWKARQAERVESVPDEITEEVIARLATLLE
jgi:mRNA interferase ChpB